MYLWEGSRTQDFALGWRHQYHLLCASDWSINLLNLGAMCDLCSFLFEGCLLRIRWHQVHEDSKNAPTRHMSLDLMGSKTRVLNRILHTSAVRHNFTIERTTRAETNASCN